MLLVKNLLKSLMRFAETGELTLKPGIIRTGDAEPILDITNLEGNKRDAIKISKELLDAITENKIEVIDAVANTKVLYYSMFSAGDMPGTLVPSVTNLEQLVYSIYILARICPTGVGDSLAHRVAKCERCKNYFLRKTRKGSKFCGMKCRSSFFNKIRIENGFYRAYYDKRKKRGLEKPTPA